MRVFCLLAGLCGALAALPAAAQPETGVTALNYAVMRNEQQIGTSTVRLSKNGGETIAETVTQLRVRIANFVVYRFDQQQTERWADGRLVALHSVTNENGVAHKVT